MQVLKPYGMPAADAPSPLFPGGAITCQPLVTPAMSQDLSLNIVNGSPGARHTMHTHTSDQVLFVTAGMGIIAMETHQDIISVGDVVHIPAQEKHWHGATPHSAFSHMALTAQGSQTTHVEG